MFETRGGKTSQKPDTSAANVAIAGSFDEKGADSQQVRYLSMEKVDEQICLTENEKIACMTMAGKFPLKVSDYYLSRIKDQAPDNPLRKIIIPTVDELLRYEDDDHVDVHMDESKYQPVPGIIHRYPGKLLFLATLECFGHCRFCFRSERQCETVLSMHDIDRAIQYIEETHDIRDVVFTGGDPMTLPIDLLEELISRVRAIRHVEIIRITSRIASYAPHMMDERMVKMLAKYRPVIFIHSFLHPDEVGEETVAALERMSKSGLTQLTQGPILRGINDSGDILKKMYEKLVMHGVIPYYLVYGLMTKGTRHFTVQKQEVKSIVKSLENNTSGYCIPHLSTLDLNNNKTRTIN